MKCYNCGSFDLSLIHKDTYICNDCGRMVEGYESRSKVTPVRMSHYDRTKAAVYATGNKWAIENFHATHD